MKKKTFTQKYWNKEVIKIFSLGTIVAGVVFIISMSLFLFGLYGIDPTLHSFNILLLFFIGGTWITVTIAYIIIIFIRGIYFICKKGAK